MVIYQSQKYRLMKNKCDGCLYYHRESCYTNSTMHYITKKNELLFYPCSTCLLILKYI